MKSKSKKNMKRKTEGCCLSMWKKNGILKWQQPLVIRKEGRKEKQWLGEAGPLPTSGLSLYNRRKPTLWLK